MDDRLISLNAAKDEIESIVDTMSVCISMDECKGMRRMKKTVLERIKALPPAQPDKWDDTVYRKAVEMLLAHFVPEERYAEAVDGLRRLPSAQPNLSEAYSKAVFTWLMDYQIRAADLKGRYTPFEVLSWVVNDWMKEHERSD